MTQLTLRGFDPELERRLHEFAARGHLSLNKAALKLMRRGAGLETSDASSLPIGNRLQQFAGPLSSDKASAIDDAIDASIASRRSCAAKVIVLLDTNAYTAVMRGDHNNLPAPLEDANGSRCRASSSANRSTGFVTGSTIRTTALGLTNGWRNRLSTNRQERSA